MGSEESCTFLISPPTLLLLVASSFRKVTVTITVTQDRRWTARRAATTAALYTVMPIILGPDGPKFIPAVAQATTDKDAPGAALGVQLTQGTSLPPGKALTVPTEVEEDGGTNLPHGKAPAVPAYGGGR